MEFIFWGDLIEFLVVKLVLRLRAYLRASLIVLWESKKPILLLSRYSWMLTTLNIFSIASRPTFSLRYSFWDESFMC